MRALRLAAVGFLVGLVLCYPNGSASADVVIPPAWETLSASPLTATELASWEALVADASSGVGAIPEGLLAGSIDAEAGVSVVGDAAVATEVGSAGALGEIAPTLVAAYFAYKTGGWLGDKAVQMIWGDHAGMTMVTTFGVQCIRADGHIIYGATAPGTDSSWFDAAGSDPSNHWQGSSNPAIHTGNVLTDGSKAHAPRWKPPSNAWCDDQLLQAYGQHGMTYAYVSKIEVNGNITSLHTFGVMDPGQIVAWILKNQQCTVLYANASSASKHACLGHAVQVDTNGNPTTQAVPTNPDTNTRCVFGSQVVGAGNCTAPKTATTGTTSTTDTTTNGGTTTTTTTGTNPGTGDPASDNCIGGAWSLNPVDWVFVPVKCALKWAFVPDSASLRAKLQSAMTALSASAPGQAVALLGGVGSAIASLGTGSAGPCQGPALPLKFDGHDTPVYPVNACPGSVGHTVALLVKPLSTLVIIVGAVLTIAGTLGGALDVRMPWQSA
jgi:hypothetical protein